MGEQRKWATHTRWTEAEEAVLREHYATAPYSMLEEMLPGRARWIGERIAAVEAIDSLVDAEAA